MTKEKIDFFKKKLEDERKLLLKEIQESERPPVFGNHDLEAEDEETDEAEELSNQIAIASSLKNRLAEVDMALSKIQENKYGTCEECGKQIDSEVLEISPESRLCRNCKLEK